MIVVPAIDIRGGRVVRLREGCVENETVYGGAAAEVARAWEQEGAERLHLVDLDAAILGTPQFHELAVVIDAVSIPVEVGGGIRTLKIAQRYIDRGADRVIFGTAAVAEPDLVQQAVARWEDKVVVALDLRLGKVAVAGWNEVAEVKATDLALEVKAWGVSRLQYTDVTRDGTLTGPNLPGIEAVARLTRMKITAAGGMSELEDVRRICGLQGLGVDEVIIGKALYDKRFTLKQAIEASRC